MEHIFYENNLTSAGREHIKHPKKHTIFYYFFNIFNFTYKFTCIILLSEVVICNLTVG